MATLSVTSSIVDVGPSLLETAVPKFPHTRAQLSAFARQYKPLENPESDVEGGEDFNRVTSSFVYRVISMLSDEQEDELKGLLKDIYGMDDEAVSALLDDNAGFTPL